MKKIANSFFISAASFIITMVWAESKPVGPVEPIPFTDAGHTPLLFPSDTDSLVYKMKDESYGLPMQNDYSGGLYLNDPSNIKTDIVYDPDSNRYDIIQKIGEINYRPSTYMTQDEYIEYQFKQSIKDYWKQRSTAESMTQEGKTKNLIQPIKFNSNIMKNIFGSDVVDIRPQGSAELIFGVNSSYTENPIIPEKQRRITTFDFDEKIQLNLLGKIGDRLKITTNYNTQATFDFENKIKLEFAGGEDDIIKKLEAGNVSLPLNSTLISGSQSLFGIKTELQFGKATVTTVVSQEKGQKKEISIENGAQTSTFEINGDNYEKDKHFFLSHQFKENYDTALKNLPVVNSGINITKMEVWITNTSSNINETRNIIALTDIGENKLKYLANPVYVNASNAPIPDNTANNLNPPTLLSACPNCPSIRNVDSATTILTTLGLRAEQDFVKVLAARKLSASEFTFNPRLGFVSLNTNVNPDQVIGVAYQFTYNGETYQVGELSTDGIADPKCLLVKMLKSTNVSPRRDTLLWDLMMKNVYAIGAYQVKPDNFKLDIFYNNPMTGTDVPVLPEKNLNSTIQGKPLIQVMHLDRINSSGDSYPDGIFDFVDGVTINAANGRIYFPVRKPFGEHLRKKINPNNDPTLSSVANKYAYDQLYDSTKYTAQQFPDKNRFKIKGSYKSTSGSEISLNAPNIPQGSVIVTAGGVPLTENVDYTVDYNLGKVKIINDGILSSGTPIKISFESNVLFGFQQKTLLGTRLDYRVNRDFRWGATAMRLNERPLMQKVNIGDEPIRNTVIGLDGNYRTEFPFLTRMIDKLPLISTKEISTITASSEVAALIPGHSRHINDPNSKEPNAYLDDFEGSQTPIDIKAYSAWQLASTPQGNNPVWPEGSRNDSAVGFNRAKFCWYTIDPSVFQRQTNNLTPAYYTNAMMSDNYQREIFENELFPKKESPTQQPVPLPTLDLAFYPSERGMYNYEAGGVSGISAGTESNGRLKNPQTRWGGIMRKIEINDFEAANVEFIQLWMMDPFNPDLGSPYNNLALTSGEMIIHLGNISEDVLKDGKKSFENGLPTSVNDQTHPVDTTSWGVVPKIQAIVNAFDNDPSTRTEQDVGLDGLKTSKEISFFAPYLAALSSIVTTTPSPSFAGEPNALSDPSSDYYHYYRGNDYDAAQLNTLERYKYFNGHEGNSPVNTGDYPTSNTTLPNSEDINRDNNLSETEGYFQYRIKISPNDLSPTNVGNNYINNVIDGNPALSTLDGSPIDVKWYQIKIPVKEFEAKYGNIEDFKSIRFVRFILRGFDKPVVLRLAKVELLRGEWRKYTYGLAGDGEFLGDDNPGTIFDVSAVNYEEHGTKNPVNYVLPPDIERQYSYGSSVPVHQNEQAMALKVCNLEDGDARATYKNIDMDMRSYKKLKMYIHTEALPNGPPLNHKDLTCFIRLGSDYTQNYYEYEIPLYVTPPGNYDNDNKNDRLNVWKPENEMEIVFSALQKAKQLRNEAMYSGQTTLSKRFMVNITDPEGRSRTIYVKGNPNLAEVRTIMIGIRNPKKTPADNDDGLPKCGEIWVNELRLSEFDEKGGWASTAHVTTKLADLGTLTVAGNMSTPGWGSIEKKVSERQRETRYQYDISSQIQLHRFMPSDWGINLPMYTGYSQAITRPQYNPLDPDIYLNNALQAQPNDSMKKDLKNRTIEETERKSINFTNVKKEKSKNSKINTPFDISNFAFNYSYSQLYNRNASIEFHNMRDYRGGFVYGYSPNVKNIQPFKKSKILNKKAFALIRDFNFTPFPSKYSMLVDVNRYYSEKKDRNTTGLSDADINLKPFYDKKFTMLRSYDLKWDIAKSLKLDFHADNHSRILEPPGALDSAWKKKRVRGDFFKGGNNVMYMHRAKADYTVPINKFPLTDWITVNAGYGTDYKWTRALYSADSLGNFLQNGNQKSVNAQANMLTLYNKIPYLKKINQGIKKKEDPKKPIKPTLPENTPPKTEQDTAKKKEKKPFLLPQYVLRSAMMLKNVSVNYTNNAGMSLAGYSDSTWIMGTNHKNGFAPGAGFIFGQQSGYPAKNGEFTYYAADKGWLKKEKDLNVPFTKNKTENITARANLEPLPGFKLELNANRNFSKNTSEFFRWGWDTTIMDSNFVRQSPTENGNFSISFITWKTAFEKIKKDYSSESFRQFLNNRDEISQQLASIYYPASVPASGYAPGFGPTSQSTLMFAFLSAYSGKDPKNYPLQTFPQTPKPNWRITYDGLAKIKPLKKIFKTIMLSHTYRSSYSFTYTGNLKSKLDKPGIPTQQDANNNYIFYEQINSVSIAEQFSPLIKIDVSLQQGMQFNFEIKKDRNLALSFANNQLTEVNGKELIIGSGYRWKNLELKNPFKKDKNKKSIKSDLNLKADFSIRQNLTVIRKIVEEVTQPTAGQTIYSLKTSADYQITQRITARLFYDWIFTNPRISTSFKSSNTNAGVSIRFSLI